MLPQSLCKHPRYRVWGKWRKPAPNWHWRKCPSCATRVTRAEAIIAWIEVNLVVPEGKLVGQPVKLARFQRRIIRKIYDNHRSSTRTAIISFARKNGKTALAAMLCLVHLCGPMAQPNSQLYSCARSKKQAAVLYGLASKMVRMSQTLSPHVYCRDNSKEIYYPELGTEYCALSAEASTKYGFSPIFVVHDELGQVKGEQDDLYDAIETGMAAHEEPLSLVISTQAATDGDLFSILIDDALTGADPSTIVDLHTADPKEFDGKEGRPDAFGIEALKAANPAFDAFQNKNELFRQRDRAQRVPSRENAYRNLNVNQRVERNSPYVSRAIWEACALPVAPIEEWTGKVYGGFDLSEVQDLTSYALITLLDSLWHVQPYFFLPSEGIRARSKRDKVPYDRWAEQGLIVLTPGKSVSYDFVAEHVQKTLSKIKLDAAGFDRWGWRHFEPWLKEKKVPQHTREKFIPVGMGEKTMTPALRTLEVDILDKKLAHGGNPVLNMCMVNAVCHETASGSRKLDKAKSSGRIDGAVALAVARHVAEEKRGKGSGPKIRNL